MGLRNQPEERTVSVKTPRTATLNYLNARFIVTVKEFVP
jgi:hypothetical protein